MFCFLEHLDQELDEPRLHSCTLPCLVCWQELLILLLGVLLPNNKYIIIKPQQKCSSIKVASIESIPCYKSCNRTEKLCLIDIVTLLGLVCTRKTVKRRQYCRSSSASNTLCQMSPFTWSCTTVPQQRRHCPLLNQQQ